MERQPIDQDDDALTFVGDGYRIRFAGVVECVSHWLWFYDGRDPMPDLHEFVALHSFYKEDDQ